MILLFNRTIAENHLNNRNKKSFFEKHDHGVIKYITKPFEL